MREGVAHWGTWPIELGGGNPQDHLFGDIEVIQEHSQEWLCHKGERTPRGRGEPLA